MKRFRSYWEALSTLTLFENESEFVKDAFKNNIKGWRRDCNNCLLTNWIKTQSEQVSDNDYSGFIQTRRSQLGIASDTSSGRTLHSLLEFNKKFTWLLKVTLWFDGVKDGPFNPGAPPEILAGHTAKEFYL